MKKADFDVEMIGHASLRAHCNGKTLITDPWYVDPINCNTLYHWPPLVHDVNELAKTVDALYISHVHPDHFDPNTLKSFDLKTPIYIGKYKEKAFVNELKKLGFKNVHECPFQEPCKVEGTDFTVCIFESDYAESAAYDSSLLLLTPKYNLFNNNDCLLDRKKFEWTAKNFKIDYGFFGYSHASYFPICFDFAPAEKEKLLKYWGGKHYDMFVEAATILKPKISFPFAMGIRFLHESMLWQNISFNSAHEAVARVRKLGLEADILNPGDTYGPEGLKRRGPLLSDAENEAAIRKYAGEKKAWIEQLWASEPPARATVVAQFKDQLTELWRSSVNKYPEVKKNIIAYEITGPSGGKFYLDFSRSPGAIVVDGTPDRFDMKYTYEGKLLQLRLDKKIDWDEMNFSNRIKVVQNKYAAEFYSMLRGQDNLNSGQVKHE